MKILFTGSSSFTGYYFVKELSKKKNIIYCVIQKSLNSYRGIRKERLKLLSKIKNVKLITQVKFGDKKFLNILKKNDFNIICLHHSLTKNYNNKSFNLKKSVRKNLLNINDVFKNLRKDILVVISNTVFQDIKKKNYKYFSNYGLSKTIFNKEIIKFCKAYGIKHKSIYITNPWGIYEEQKLNFVMIKNWLKNKTLVVKFPNYIRDNIFVEKLSKAYLKIIYSKANKNEYFPSGYCSSNRVFIEEFRKKFENYFRIKTSVKYLYNYKYDQPIKRINGTKVMEKIVIKENLNNYFAYYKKILGYKGLKL